MSERKLNSLPQSLLTIGTLFIGLLSFLPYLSFFTLIWLQKMNVISRSTTPGFAIIGLIVILDSLLMLWGGGLCGTAGLILGVAALITATKNTDRKRSQLTFTALGMLLSLFGCLSNVLVLVFNSELANYLE